MCERELETEQNCNILTPTLLAITAFLSRSPGLLNRGPGAPASLGHVPQSSIFSPTGLISKLLNRWPEGSLCWVLAFSTASCLQLVWSPKLTDFLSSPNYIIVQRPPSSCGRHNFALIQPVHGQGYNSDIPRPEAPVIYTGAFPILTARPGRRSVYNTHAHTNANDTYIHYTLTQTQNIYIDTHKYINNKEYIHTYIHTYIHILDIRKGK